MNCPRDKGMQTQGSPCNVRSNARLRYARDMRNPLRLLAMLGVLAVVALAVVSIRGQFAPNGRRAAPDLEMPSGDVVSRALELAQPDSVRLKTAWVDDIPDLALAALGERGRETYLRIANGRMCDCGCGYTLAGCRRYDTTCPVSGPRARALYDSVRTGRIARADEYPERPVAM